MKTVWELTLYFCVCALAVFLVMLVQPDKSPPPVVQCECVCSGKGD